MTQLSAHLTDPPPEQAIEWVRSVVGPDTAIEGAVRLPGGTSSAVHRLNLRDRGGRATQLVLRRFTLREWNEREPDLAAREAAALRLLAATELPAPRLVAVDAAAAACDVPAVLMTLLPGATVLDPDDLDAWIREMARLLAAIHDIDWRGEPAVPPYFCWVEPEKIKASAWEAAPARWQAARERLAAHEPAFTPRFLHRDYHPGNLLWQRGRISGAVDWVNACYGPPDVDLAHCRSNLVGLQGVAAADSFLAAYEALTGRGLDVYWELLEIVDCCLDAPGPGSDGQWLDAGFTAYSIERARQETGRYVTAALQRLGA